MDAAVEEEIARLLSLGDHESAATLAMERYGPGVYRFLLARTHDADRAAEAFAQLGEDLWRGIGGFAGKSTFMTWMFTLARNAAHRIERSPHNHAARHTTSGKLARIAEDVRERTAPYLRTDVKDRFDAIRASLTPEERALLHLRVEREMQWNDIAKIVEGDEQMAGVALKRASMRVRKRFSDLTRRLREIAEREGLLDVDAG